MPKQKIQDIISKSDKGLRRTISRPQNVVRRRSGSFLDKLKKGKIVFGLVVFLLLFVLGIKTVDLFSKTIIQVKLHEEIINIDTVLKASKDSLFDLPLETMEIHITEEEITEATGVKTIASKASGTITIFNEFSSQPQSLVTNTRFETPDGKIYRIQKRLTVPGANIVDGVVQPSSIEATVYADEPGEDYNISLTDFRIPGFKEGPRYDKFYARSKTPMTGGFRGEIPIISESDSLILKTSLEKSIASKLIDKAVDQKPDGFLLYEKAVDIQFSENLADNDIDPKKPKFTLKETGSLFAALLSEEAVSKILVRKYLGEDYQNKVQVKNADQLGFELITLDVENKVMVFKLIGQAKFVWTIDEDTLKDALVASPKNMEEVFKSYSSIDHAAVVFKPSWWRFFPEKSSKIRIEPVE
ncbi:hypothetical protein ACFLZC_02740 [Patescibacteria group bacterium]